MYNEPVLLASYWPVVAYSRADHAELIGSACYRENGPCYSCKVPGCGFVRRLPLARGGNTTPIACDYEPIPAPKTKAGTETRYRCGRWEKYTKTRGWVAA